jgi:hypothetical protein
MIIAEIVGGLGNQLFEYAAARALAIHHSVPLKLDISYYEKISKTFMLDNFSFDIAIASRDELMQESDKNLFTKAIQRLLPFHKRTPFREPYYHYYPDFLKAPSETYLKGLWQSEKYFSQIKDIVKDEFIVKPGLVTHLEEKAKVMQAESSVSIHIRRGDYLHPKALPHHGLLPEEYYLEAISIIMKKHPNSKIYFFSDDIEWVKKYITEKSAFNLPYEFVSGNYTQNYTKLDLEDFYLMQQCKHNIIANSTFSWWCAWLNKNPEKIVVAPQKWYNKPSHVYKDLVPAQWLRA